VEACVVCPPGAALAARAGAAGAAIETVALGAIEKRQGVVWNVMRRAGPTMRLLGVMRRRKSELVLANGAYSFLASVFAAKLAGAPIVWLEHNTTLPGDATLRRMIGQADYIVTVSKAIRNQFVGLAPGAEGKISVIHNGVDMGRFHPDAEAGRKKRQALGWDEDALVVGTVSRLSPEKGVEHFVGAAGAVRDGLPGARFLVVGDGPERAALERRADAATVRFVGAQTDVADWLNAMDIFVMPSEAEAFGLAVVEAMGCELPVVASDVGGLREVVAEGETGVRVPPGDAEAIARAVLALARDAEKRRAFGQAGRARALECFTQEKQARAMLGVLEAQY
jgi:glycosyltransferase involved in cell wall biosynthesis